MLICIYELFMYFENIKGLIRPSACTMPTELNMCMCFLMDSHIMYTPSIVYAFCLLEAGCWLLPKRIRILSGKPCFEK